MTTAPFLISTAPSVGSGPKLNPTLFRPLTVFPAETSALAYWQLGGDATSLVDANGHRLHQHLTAVTMTSGGSGYTAAPAVAPNPATTSYMTASISGGAVSQVNLVGPGYYDAIPSIGFTGGAGAGAAASATISPLPTFEAADILIGDGGMNGLASEILDTATGWEYAVVQWPAPSTLIRPVFVTQLSGGKTGSGVLFLPSGDLQIGNAANPSAPANDVIQKPAGIAYGDYVFIAMGFLPDGTRVLYLGGQSFVTRAGIVKPPFGNRTKGIGNTFYNVPSWFGGLRFAAYGILPDSLAIADIDGVYAREQNRMRNRGVPVD